MNNAIKQNVRMGMILTPRLDQESISTVFLLTPTTQKICFCFFLHWLHRACGLSQSKTNFICIPSLIFRQNMCIKHQVDAK